MRIVRLAGKAPYRRRPVNSTLGITGQAVRTLRGREDRMHSLFALVHGAWQLRSREPLLLEGSLNASSWNLPPSQRMRHFCPAVQAAGGAALRGLGPVLSGSH